MKKKKENKLYWRRLDNSAKIFPISAGKKYSTVFRLSVVLTEKIEPNILKEAVNQALSKYVSFKVKMKTGFFWFYFEENQKLPKVEEEKDYPCTYIDPRKNNDYLFKVTYFENKINIDIFHSLTDPLGARSVIHEIIDLNRLKEECKKYDATVTQYLTSVLIYSIYKENYIKKKSKSKKPIKVCIPVNLKKYFPSKTMSNFFSYITVEAEVIKDKLDTFDKIIEFVKKDFKKKLSEEEIIKTMSANVKLRNKLLYKNNSFSIKKANCKIKLFRNKKIYNNNIFKYW